MQENRNTGLFGCTQNTGNSQCTNGVVCIDTKRVLDSCRDRDCFEDTRVYLTRCGEEILSNSTNVRTRSTRILCAYVGVDEVAFNRGFYRVKIRYYIEIDFEACIGVGRSQTFKGLAALEKDVVLYGGEGRALTFTSGPANTYCGSCDPDTASTNDPTAIVETVEPIVLATRVSDCNCHCPCEYIDIPDGIRTSLGDELVTTGTGPRILVSFGIFSVIRMVRPAQLLVNATDYSVPDKECTGTANNDNPCSLFRTIAFPTNQFRGTACLTDTATTPQKPGGCGCHKTN